MTSFLDTSVLVAAFYGDHDHHEVSLAVLVDGHSQGAFTSAHCLAETYAVLTGLPGRNRVTPDQALLFLADVRARLTIAALSEVEYTEALTEAAAHGIAGGGIYDMLIARCARKVGATALYTWNVKHFTRLGPDIARITRRP